MFYVMSHETVTNILVMSPVTLLPNKQNFKLCTFNIPVFRSHNVLQEINMLTQKIDLQGIQEHYLLRCVSKILEKCLKKHMLVFQKVNAYTYSCLKFNLEYTQ